MLLFKIAGYINNRYFRKAMLLKSNQEQSASWEKTSCVQIVVVLSDNVSNGIQNATHVFISALKH